MKPFTVDDIKRIINFSVDIGPTGYSFIDNRYQAYMDRWGDTLQYYRLFFHLTQRLEPLLTVELGSWQGTSAAHFAQGYLAGDVITIDHHTDLGDDLNIDKVKEAEAHYSNLIYVKGWTRDDLAESQREKHKLGDAGSAYSYVRDYIDKNMVGIDILFIDSWHNSSEAMADWEAYRSLLSEVSLIICDDISDVDMLAFWDELPGEKFLENRMHTGIPMGFMRNKR